MQHLLAMDELTASDIESLCLLAKHYKHQNNQKNKKNLYYFDQPLKNQRVALLFFENSTRTQLSFELAAKHLGAICLSPVLSQSSLEKGESIADMVNTLAAMGVTYFVIRHPEDSFCQDLAKQLLFPVHIINAGTGQAHHPSQALLDLFTLKEMGKNLKQLSIALVGDLKHSRVAHSLVTGLRCLGTTDIRLIAPKSLLPNWIQNERSYTNLHDGLKHVDAIVCLRLQRERLAHDEAVALNQAEFFHHFRLNHDHLQLAKPDAVIMHPGPVNRDHEIVSELVDSSQSVIFKQVQHGLFMRMAVLTQIGQFACVPETKTLNFSVSL